MAMKLHDVGEKHGGMVCETSKNKVWYPSLRFDTKQIPELKNFKFGDSVVLHITGKIKGMDLHNNEAKHFSIEVKKAGVAKGSGTKTDLSKELGV